MKNNAEEIRHIECPLYTRLITDDECFDLHCAEAPEYFIPKEIREIPKYNEICLKCKNHRFD